jgi:hypothetical protein
VSSFLPVGAISVLGFGALGLSSALLFELPSHSEPASGFGLGFSFLGLCASYVGWDLGAQGFGLALI